MRVKIRDRPGVTPPGTARGLFINTVKLLNPDVMRSVCEGGGGSEGTSPESTTLTQVSVRDTLPEHATAFRLLVSHIQQNKLALTESYWAGRLCVGAPSLCGKAQARS